MVELKHPLVYQLFQYHQLGGGPYPEMVSLAGQLFSFFGKANYNILEEAVGFPCRSKVKGDNRQLKERLGLNELIKGGPPTDDSIRAAARVAKLIAASVGLRVSQITAAVTQRASSL